MTVGRKAIALVVCALILAGLGIYFLRESGTSTSSVHSIAVYKVALDKVDGPSDESTYVVFVNVTNAGTSAWDSNSTSYEVVSNASTDYQTAAPPFSGTNGSAIVPPGQHRSVQLFFQMPATQSPSELTYTDHASGMKTTAEVPQVSSWVSKFSIFTYLNKTGTGNYVIGIQAYAVIFNTTYAAFVNDHAVYYFFTGDRITVGIEVEYYKSPAAPENIMISSVTNADGFNIVSVSPSLPVTMSGWGSRAEVQITFLAPADSYAKGLHFVVGFYP